MALNNAFEIYKCIVPNMSDSKQLFLHLYGQLVPNNNTNAQVL